MRSTALQRRTKVRAQPRKETIYLTCTSSDGVEHTLTMTLGKVGLMVPDNPSIMAENVD